MPDQVTFDLDTLTLGELAKAEEASGQDLRTLMSRRSTRLMLAVFISRLRKDGRALSWSEVEALPVRDVLFSTSDSSPVSLSGTSQD